MGQFDHLTIKQDQQPAEPEGPGLRHGASFTVDAQPLTFNAHSGGVQSAGGMRVKAHIARGVDVGGGQRASREVAERMGLIPEGAEPVSDVVVSEVQTFGRQTPPAPAPAEQDAPPIQAEHAESREVLVRDLPAATLNALVQDILSEGGKFEQITQSGAESMGVPRERVAATVQSAITGLQAQADTFVANSGLVPSEVWAWAKKSRPQEMRAAMREHFYTGSPDSYRGLVDRYNRTVAPSSERLEANDIPTWVNKHTGERMVSLEGHTMSLRTAIRCGFIKSVA